MFFASRPSLCSRIGVRVFHRDALVRAGLVAAFAHDHEVRVVEGDHSLPDDAPFDPVILADYDAGLDLVRSACTRSGSGAGRTPKVMVVTHQERESEIRHALEQGVQGYLLVGCSLADLRDGVRALNDGLRYVSPSAARRLADSLSHPALTARELIVLRWLSSGASNKAIAIELDIALGTVKAHVRMILDKLGARTRTEAAAIALVRGLSPDGSERIVLGAQSVRHSSGLLRGI